jgi:hypothetical protein
MIKNKVVRVSEETSKVVAAPQTLDVEPKLLEHKIPVEELPPKPEFNFEELISLIKVREYVHNSIGNFMIDRPTINYLNQSLSMIDKKIITQLKSTDFKNYLNPTEVKESATEVAVIKSSIVK